MGQAPHAFVVQDGGSATEDELNSMGKTWLISKRLNGLALLMTCPKRLLVSSKIRSSGW